MWIRGDQDRAAGGYFASLLTVCVTHLFENLAARLVVAHLNCDLVANCAFADLVADLVTDAEHLPRGHGRLAWAQLKIV